MAIIGTKRTNRKMQERKKPMVPMKIAQSQTVPA